jgi:hypothetical protein
LEIASLVLSWHELKRVNLFAFFNFGSCGETSGFVF